MKLLFDQNLSHKLVERLKDQFPESDHVRNLNLSDKDDYVVWEFAKKEDFTIVSQDSDFLELSLIKGFPPKIIWIRAGNSSTIKIESILRDNSLIIKSFIESDKDYCLELD